MIRSFVAITLDAATRAAVAREVDRLRQVERPGRAVAWVPAANLHLTLKFLGRQSERELEALRVRLEGVLRPVTTFPVTLAGLGAFPGLDRPRVLWVGLAEGAAAARELQARVEGASAELGLPPETRAWHPHLTIGRVPDERRWRREAIPALREAIAAAHHGSLGRFAVDRVILMRSDLSPAGARYTEMASLPLAPGPQRGSQDSGRGAAEKMGAT